MKPQRGRMTTPTQVLAVEDDADARRLLAVIFRDAPEVEATIVSDPSEALTHLRESSVDVLLTDLRMPGTDGLALAEQARGFHPDLPVLLMTAHPTVDSAVLAMRTGLTDFLVKPLNATSVIGAVVRAAAQRGQTGHRVLAIGAHPDDVEIGAGATLARHFSKGDEVRILTMSRGHVGGDEGSRVDEAHRAADVLGAALELRDLEDTRIPDHGPTVRAIEQAIREFAPHTVYVHSDHDVHQDHRAVHRATMVAARAVPRVLCYQSPSATIDFRPSRFVRVDDQLDTKLEAIAAYSSQTAIRDYLEEDLLRSTARVWGRFGRCRYAEAFEVIRDSLEENHVHA